MRSWSSIIIAIPAACCFLSLAQAADKIRIAIPDPNAAYLTFPLALKKGFFTQQNIAAEVFLMRGTLTMAALNNGDINYLADISQGVRGSIGSLPVKIVACYLPRSSLMANRYIRSNREGTVQFLVDWMRIDKDVAVATYQAFLPALSEDGQCPEDGMETARKAAASKSTVLLLGESGTGKEVFARAIHNWSERKTEPFIAINCVGLSKDLLESELFGHERGAFTGASQLKKGKMELAHGGTVFLDEVGDISAELQTKLLRFLQEREFERVGGTQPIPVDVRVVAATNRELSSAIKEGRFREDLYYRLNVIPISLPPLRERTEDIPALAQFFLKRFAAETKKIFSGITREAEGRLLAYGWPGNVRELANVIERAVVLGQGPEITDDDLPLRIAVNDIERTDGALSYRHAVDGARADVIRKALAHTQGNRAAAARVLGMHCS